MIWLASLLLCVTMSYPKTFDGLTINKELRLLHEGVPFVYWFYGKNGSSFYLRMSRTAYDEVVANGIDIDSIMDQKAVKEYKLLLENMAK